MAKIYVHPLRRGWKITDVDGKTTQNDWEDYEKDAEHVKPIEGELVLEYDNGLPRLKIGDGVHEFSELPYMSIDSFILPRQESVYLSTEWQQDATGRYFQEVTVNNATITPKSKVDLQPTSHQLRVFQQKDVTFVAENNGGRVYVYCVGIPPKSDYTIPVTVTEIVTNDKTIIGNTTATPYPQPDWSQTDETKADYIKNKPDLYRYVRKEEIGYYIHENTSGCVKNTDYVVAGSKAGIVNVENAYGLNTMDCGELCAVVDTPAMYNLKPQQMVIGKGTLENIKYQYVKEGLVNNNETLSKNDQENVCAWLGAATPNYVNNLPDNLALTEDTYDKYGNVTYGTQTKWRSWLNTGTKLYAHKVMAELSGRDNVSAQGYACFLIVSTISTSLVGYSVASDSDYLLSIKGCYGSVVRPDNTQPYIDILSTADDGTYIVYYAHDSMQIEVADLFEIKEDVITEL